MLLIQINIASTQNQKVFYFTMKMEFLKNGNGSVLSDIIDRGSIQLNGYIIITS